MLFRIVVMRRPLRQPWWALRVETIPHTRHTKNRVGPFYLTPLKIFTVTFRNFDFNPEELTVISWILPQTDATKSDSPKEKICRSERWARARIFGEAVNEKLQKHAVGSLEPKEVQAVAPSITPQLSLRISPKYGFASTWSERNAAYAARLGIFGLCDGLITQIARSIASFSPRVSAEIASLDAWWGLSQSLAKISRHAINICSQSPMPM